MAQADTPSSIGGHRVERPLGAGGMGRVYLCRDAALDRSVAIKVLQPDLLEQTEMRARFLREARALARVTSPNVVLVHAVGEDPSAGPFVVMEYLDGEDLQARLNRSGPMPWREAIAITRDAVAGLKAAQQASIVHRDVKPANLFVVAGRAKITDFGLAREVQADASLTQAGLVVGTPSYLAPEVIRGNAATHTSDLYSLGATLFHLISGRPPFQHEAPLEVLAAAIREEPPRLTSLVPEIPAALDALVARMLTKDPTQRPPSWDALDAELVRIASGASAAEGGAAPSSAAGRAESGAAPSSAAGASAADGPSSSTMALGSLAPLPSGVNALDRSAPRDDGGSLASAVANPTSSDAIQTMSIPMTPAGANVAKAVAPSATSSPGSGGTPGTAAFSIPTTNPGAQAAAMTSGEHVKIKTQSLTVMMTDIAGYTERTSRVSREESARWLALHDSLLTPTFRAFSGKVIKTLGDAFLVTFASPTDAVHCACAIQDRLWAHNKSARPEDAIHVRVALAAGEVRLHKGDVFGEPVNLAARIEGLAQAGEVLLSDSVYSTMNAAEVKLESRGAQTLKGIARPVVIYAAVADNTGDATQTSYPYGGRALARVKGSRVDVLRASAPMALAKVAPAAAAMKSAILRPQNRKIVLGALLAMCVVVGVAFVVANAGDDRLERIRNGEATVVLDELSKIKDDEKTGLDWALIGHARIALGVREKAFAAFARAIDKQYTDGDMRTAALAALEEKIDGGAVDLLIAWPNNDADGELKAMLKGENWWPRHHALKILEERKLVSDEQRVQVALIDVTSSECADRRYGLGLLKKHGKNEEALQAVRALGSDLFRNACLMLDVGASEAAIRKRMKEDP